MLWFAETYILSGNVFKSSVRGQCLWNYSSIITPCNKSYPKQHHRSPYYLFPQLTPENSPYLPQQQNLPHPSSPGEYAGFDDTEPTSRTGGKGLVIRRLKEQHSYQRVIMIGDGATDAEASPPAEGFIGKEMLLCLVLL